MSNVFYAPGEQRAAKVNDLFAAIARRYDLLNDLQSFGLHRRWKRRVVRTGRRSHPATARSICAAAPATSPSPSPGAARKRPVSISARKCSKSPKPRRSRNQNPKSHRLRNSEFHPGRRAANSLSRQLLRHRDRRLRPAESGELGTRAGRNAPRGPARRAAHRAGFWQAAERALARDLFHAPEMFRAAHRAGCFAATRRPTPTFWNR